MKIVGDEDVRGWYAHAPSLSAWTQSIGAADVEPSWVESVLGVPLHLRMVIEQLRAARGEVPQTALDSIPFFSLCKGLFIPLSGMTRDRIAGLFGIDAPEPPGREAREQLVRALFAKQIGLTLEQKLGCVLGDPFLGRPSTFRRDSLLRILQTSHLVRRNDLLDRLAHVGDVAILFAELEPDLHKSPPLTAAEVLESLRLLPEIPRADRFAVLDSLLERCGRLEAFFLSKLLLRKASFGFDYQGELLCRMVAEAHGADPAQVSHATALTDIFHVARVLRDQGADGLRSIELKPLVPVRPALAGGLASEIDHFPVWVERKYDGIRFTLHKSTDRSGAVLCGAYTRNRNDWLELVAGLDATLRRLPARNIILDGELHGTVLDYEGGARPGSVYDVYGSLQGNGRNPVNLRFAAFDLIYLEGRDLTARPLWERRQILSSLIAPLANFPLPVPITLAEGQQANSAEDVNRLFHHFRAQGYEGIIAKDPQGQYHLGARDPSWRKRKPEATLDLVVLGAVLAVTSKETAGRFGSYVIGARNKEGTFDDVGDVAGVDRVRDMEIQQEILRDGLLTGRRIERPSASGVRPGFELRPSIVLTVRFEGIVRDGPTGKLQLRDPKVVAIRSDKPAAEADSTLTLEELFLRQRMG